MVVCRTSVTVKQMALRKSLIEKCATYVAVNRFPLPKWERYMCWVCTILSLLHLTYRLYIICLEHYDALKDYYLIDGWSVLQRKKDASIVDWTEWNIWIPFMVPCFIVHAVFGQALRWNSKTYKYRSYIMMVVDIVLTIHLIGVQPVLMLSSHCVLVYITALMFRQPRVVWMVSLGLLLSLTSDYVLNIVKQMVGDDPFESKLFAVVRLISWGSLRYISFTLEMCIKLQAHVNGYSFLDLLAYVFYFPQIINGPHQNYDIYKTQMSLPLIPWTLSRILAWSVGLVRVVFWWFFVEVLLHYIYVSAIVFNPPVLVQLSTWTVFGVVIYRSLIFSIVYLVIYGVSAKLSELDQLDPPRPPGCSWRIYTYSMLWKTFDRGLHQFLKRYIYIPLGGSRQGFARRLLGYSLAFAFIFEWHGRSPTIFIWSSIHWFGMTAEYFVCSLEKYARVAALKHVYPQTFMRVTLVMYSVMYISLPVSMIFFFGGINSGIACLLKVASGLPFPVLVVIYMYLVVARDAEDWLKQQHHRSLEDY